MVHIPQARGFLYPNFQASEGSHEWRKPGKLRGVRSVVPALTASEIEENG
jgi:hypothetical protein